VSSYGRNFDFRRPPEPENRPGRFVLPATGTPVAIGAPIEVDTAGSPNALDLTPVVLATAAGGVNGLRGIMVYEYGPAAYAGFDPLLTTYSDLGTAPLGAAVQMVSSREIKCVFRNTVAQTFLGTRHYAGRKMVAGVLGTDVVVGTFLKPGPGSDANGYWQATATEADAWLVTENVNEAAGEVEARFLF
jgi:hypothetical protein